MLLVIILLFIILLAILYLYVFPIDCNAIHETFDTKDLEGYSYEEKVRDVREIIHLSEKHEAGQESTHPSNTLMDEDGNPLPDKAKINANYHHDKKNRNNRVDFNLVLPPGLTPPVTNCTYSEWSEWGECSNQCGKGTRTRTRVVKTPAKGGGTCNTSHSHMTETEACEGNDGCMRGGISSNLNDTGNGLLFYIVDGYHQENAQYFANGQKKILSGGPPLTGFTGISTAFNSISNCTNNATTTNGKDQGFSVLFTGFLYTGNYEGPWQFWLTSEDGSYFWIGNNASNGYSASNATINNGGIRNTFIEKSAIVQLQADEYYPIRIMYGCNKGNYDLQFSYQYPGGKRMYDNGNGILVTPVPVPSECEYSAWGPWGNCDTTCGVGTQISTRTVEFGPTFGGKCDTTSSALTRSQSCTTTTTCMSGDNSEPDAIQKGMLYMIYKGYHNENANYADGGKVGYKTLSNDTALSNYIGIATNFNDIGKSTNGATSPNGRDTQFTIVWNGYLFTGTNVGSWTFWLNSDDGSYFWIGATAQVGYTTANANINNGGIHKITEKSCTVSLNANTYYPVRIMYGQSADTYDFQFSFRFPGGSRQTDGSHYFVTSQPGPIDCTYSDWGAYSDCSVKCGGGTSSSTRTVILSELFGGKCARTIMDLSRSVICNTQECSIDCAYGEWGPWSSCSTTCGVGTMTRSRPAVPPKFGGAACVTSNTVDTTTCSASASCAAGAEVNKTSIQKGLLYIIYDGYHNDDTGYCEKNASKFRYLTNSNNTNITGFTNSLANIVNGTVNAGVVTDVNYTVRWTGYLFTGAYLGVWQFTLSSSDGAYFWIGPNATSGFNASNANINNGGVHGYKSASCQVALNANAYYPIRIMYGHSSSGSGDCQFLFNPPGAGVMSDGNGMFFSDPPAAINCVYGDWGAWGACSASCGGGSQSQTRHVLFAAHYGGTCNGATTQSQPCNKQPCPINCQYSWGPWSGCDQNTGLQTRYPIVSVPANYGGQACPGPQQQACPVDCQYTWGDWSGCSKSCDTGTKTRYPIVSVTAKNGGQGCPAPNVTSCSTGVVCQWSGCNSDSHCAPGTACRIGDHRCLTDGDCNWANGVDHTNRDCNVMGTNIPFNGGTDHETNWDSDGNCGRAVYLDRHNVDCGNSGALQKIQLVDNWNGNTMHYQYRCTNGGRIDSKFGNSTGWDQLTDDCGVTQYLDRHNVNCGQNAVLTQFNLSRRDGSTARYDYTCGRTYNPLKCRTVYTPWQANFGGNVAVIGNSEAGHMECNANEAISQFHLETMGDDGKGYARYQYTCCSTLPKT